MENILDYNKEKIFDSIDEGSIKFYLEDENKQREIQLRTIFSDGYSGLDNIINKNITNEKISDDEKRVVFDNWWSNREQQYKVEINIEGDPYTFDIDFRSNFNGGLLKHPNIVYLKNKGQTFFIIRNPVQSYDEHIKKIIKSSFDFEVSTKPYDGTIPEESPMVIPESTLTYALNELSDEGYPFVIPKNIEFSNNSCKYFLRPWMNEPHDDTTLDPAIIGKHFGYLKAIGLITKHDRQSEHYFVNNYEGQQHLVNIDPDFFVWLPLDEKYEEDFEQEEEDFLTDLTRHQICFDENARQTFEYAKNEFTNDAVILHEEFYRLISRENN